MHSLYLPTHRHQHTSTPPYPRLPAHSEGRYRHDSHPAMDGVININRTATSGGSSEYAYLQRQLSLLARSCEGCHMCTTATHLPLRVVFR